MLWVEKFIGFCLIAIANPDPVAASHCFANLFANQSNRRVINCLLLHVIDQNFCSFIEVGSGDNQIFTAARSTINGWTITSYRNHYIAGRLPEKADAIILIHLPLEVVSSRYGWRECRKS